MKFKIKSLVYEAVNEDGSVEDVELGDCCDLGNIAFLKSDAVDSCQTFWIASDHGGIMGGNRAIASPVPGQFLDKETLVNRTNTLIGMVRDGTCQVFASYELPELSLVK